MDFTNERYGTLRDICKGRWLLLAFIDLDSFDASVDFAAR
jgi:hypothetical protein